MERKQKSDRLVDDVERSNDPRAIRTRAALRQALLDLLETQPFDDISPGDIAKVAGLSRATFYLHHRSKEAMLDELAKTEASSLYAQALSVLDEMGSRVAALAFCEYIAERKALWSVLLNGGAATMVRDELLRLSRDVAAERAVPGDRLPAELSTAISASSMVEIVAWWLRQTDDRGIEYAADLMVELVFNPIRQVSTSRHLKFR